MARSRAPKSAVRLNAVRFFKRAAMLEAVAAVHEFVPLFKVGLVCGGGFFFGVVFAHPLQIAHLFAVLLLHFADAAFLGVGAVDLVAAQCGGLQQPRGLLLLLLRFFGGKAFFYG